MATAASRILASSTMPAPEVRRLSAIMLTDMVGYSALIQADESLALTLLDEHNGLLRQTIAEHQGREIKTTGDGFLVEFDSALEAVRCAIQVQRSLAARNGKAPQDRQIQVRIGLHLGDVIRKDGDVFGDGVNIAARIEPLAEPGGICLSEDVARQVQNKIDCPVEKIGAGELKNIDLPVELYRIVLPWTRARSAAAHRLSFLWRKKAVRRTAVAAAFAAVLLTSWLLRPHSGAPGPVNRLAV